MVDEGDEGCGAVGDIKGAKSEEVEIGDTKFGTLEYRGAEYRQCRVLDKWRIQGVQRVV